MSKLSLHIILITLVSVLCAQSSLDGNMLTESWDENTEESIVKSDLIYPNPTYGRVSFDLSQYDDKNFRVVIKNIIAREIWSKSYNQRRFEEDFGFLEKGTYVLAVENTEGYALFSRRLIIITP